MAVLFVAVFGISEEAEADNLEWSYDAGTHFRTVAISSDGEYIVAGTGSYQSDYGVYLFSKDSPIPLWSYETGSNSVTSVSISADGEYIVASSEDGVVYLFDKDSSTPLWNYTYTTSDCGHCNTVSISANGEYFVLGSGNVYLFDKDSSTPLWQYNESARSVSISAEGDYITVGTKVDSAGDVFVLLFGKESSQYLWRYNIGVDIYSVSISADGEYITAGGGEGESGKVYLFDKDSSTPLWSYETEGAVYSVSISADAEYISVGTSNNNEDGNVYFFDKDSSTPLWSYETEGAVYSVDVSGDGKYIAVGSNDHNVSFFEKNSSTPLWRYDTDGTVYSVSISADGDYFAVGNEDKKVYLFTAYEPDPEFGFDFDTPSDGEESIDVGTIVNLSVKIDNFILDPKEFRLEIINEIDGLEAWWSHDGQNALSSESTTLDGVDVAGESWRDGITVSVKARDDGYIARYGTWEIELKCEGDAELDDYNIQYKTLKIKVNETVAVALVGPIDEGSVDIDEETTYYISVNNGGNRQDTFNLELSSNDWGASLSKTSITIEAFSVGTIAVTVVSSASVSYGDSDDLTITAISQNDGSVQGTLDLTTYVRVQYGLSIVPTSSDYSGEPGDTLTFNFQILNKWSEVVDYEITRKDWYRGTQGNQPEGWTFTDGGGTLDAFEEITTSSSSSVRVTISSGADAGEVVTIIVQAKVSDDNDNVGTIELELEVKVEAEYNVKILLLSDQFSIDPGVGVSLAPFVQVKNFAKVSDLVTITAQWEIGGEDWELYLPEPISLEASGEKSLYISVNAPDSAAGGQAILKIRAESNGDPSVFSEASITFLVNTVAGCTNETAKNYNPSVNIDDGSCVYPKPPIAIAGDNFTIDVGATTQFNGAGIDEDGTISMYEWDFNNDGVYEYSSSETGRTTNIYNSAGKWIATLRVTDNDGFTDTDTLTITVLTKDEPKEEEDKNELMEEESKLPSISLIPALISIGLIAIYRRK
jgi:WD40 repeat protein